MRFYQDLVIYKLNLLSFKLFVKLGTCTAIVSYLILMSELSSGLRRLLIFLDV